MHAPLPSVVGDNNFKINAIYDMVNKMNRSVNQTYRLIIMTMLI